VIICLGQGADLHMAQLMPVPLAVSCSSKSRLVLPFWCLLTWVVPDRIQEGRKMVCVCVCVRACMHACVCVLSHFMLLVGLSAAAVSFYCLLLLLQAVWA